MITQYTDSVLVASLMSVINEESRRLIIASPTAPLGPTNACHLFSRFFRVWPLFLFLLIHV